MEPFFRFYGFLCKIVNYLLKPILFMLFGGYKKSNLLPVLKSSVLEISATDLAEKIRNKEIKSEFVVRKYIERIREVNPLLNAVVEDRFFDAIEDAKKADQICEETSVIYIIKNYPLLGVPFTVKESCAVKNLSHSGGSLQHLGTKADKDSVVVEKLKAAGAIPLLVSNTPEYCLSWECYNHISGRTLNPYDSSRTSGGSSGGEGALLGAGASVFGVGSDIAGSIRVPSLFNGIFGHKPTAGIISLDGHFPNSNDINFKRYLTIGPMCRYAKDLPTLTYLMCDEKFHSQLRLDVELHTKDIKIYYLPTAGHSFTLWNVDESIQVKMLEAVSHFKSNGLHVERPDFGDMTLTIEIAVATFFSIDDIPFIINKKDTNNRKELWSELVKSVLGRSEYTFAGLFFFALHASGGMMTRTSAQHWIKRGEELRETILSKLGTDGVLFYPTFPQPALGHYESFTKMSGVMYTMFFNIMGFPSTHVPMGKDKNGLPIGFQVIAAPFQDRLCFAIARELEAAFGGWKL